MTIYGTRDLFQEHLPRVTPDCFIRVVTERTLPASVGIRLSAPRHGLHLVMTKYTDLSIPGFHRGLTFGALEIGSNFATL